MNYTAQTGNTDTRIQAPPEGEVERKYHGTVKLQVYCPDRLGDMMLFCQCLRSSGVVQVLTLLPTRNAETTVEVRLREPLALIKFLRLLPGVFWVAEEDSSQDAADVPTVSVLLEKNPLPKGAKSDSRMIADAALAAVIAAQ